MMSLGFLIKMEVEVRAKVKDPASLKRKLKRLGAKFGRDLAQKDWLFYSQEAIRTKKQRPGNFLIRIRSQNSKYFLALKGLTNRKGVWEEYEMAIDDPKQARKMVERMGLNLVLVFEKKRTPGKLGKIVFCLDQVKHLGSYLEMEIITTKERGKAAQQKIKEIFQKLGIDKKDTVRLGYPQIILAKKGWRFLGER